MVSFKHNYIFVHIPKCAGTSIEQALIKNEDKPLDFDKLLLPNNKGIPSSHKAFKEYYEVPQHYTLQTIHDILCDQGHLDFFNQAFIFAVVRNPLDRIRSSSSYLTKTFKTQYNIASLLHHKNIGNHRFDLNQYDWLTVNKKLKVNKIIHFENLSEGLNFVSNKLSLSIDLPKHKFESSGGDFSVNDSPRVQTLVYNKYIKDYKEFNYEHPVKVSSL